jgi:hypothetical protein
MVYLIKLSLAQTVSNSIMDNELEMMRKEAVVAYYETEESHENPHSANPVSRTRL